VDKALKSKGFCPGQPGGEEAYPGAVIERARLRQAGGLDELREAIRVASVDEKTAGAEYMDLASRAERLGLNETARRLREIAQTEMQHHRVLDEILGSWPPR